MKHIKDNYVNAFEIPSEAYNQMLKKDRNNSLYIEPRSTFVDIGRFNKYKDNEMIFHKHKRIEVIDKDDFNKLYFPKETQNKREKYIKQTNNCTKKVIPPIKDYKVHLKSKEKIDKLNKLLDNNQLSSDEIHVSEELEDDDLEGGRKR